MLKKTPSHREMLCGGDSMFEIPAESRRKTRRNRRAPRRCTESPKVRSLAESERPSCTGQNDTGGWQVQTAAARDVDTPTLGADSEETCDEQKIAGAQCRAVVARIQQLERNPVVKLDCYLCGIHTRDAVTYRFFDASFCAGCYVSLITSTFREAFTSHLERQSEK